MARFAFVAGFAAVLLVLYKKKYSNNILVSAFSSGFSQLERSGW